MVKSLSTVGWLLIALIGQQAQCRRQVNRTSLDDPVAAAREFIAEHEKTVRPLEYAASLAWWNANVSGKDEDFEAKERAQNRLDAALSDHEKFARLKTLKASLDRRPTPGSPDRGALSGLSGKAGRSRAAPPDHGQGQCHREGLQRLSRQRRAASDAGR